MSLGDAHVDLAANNLFGMWGSKIVLGQYNRKFNNGNNKITIFISHKKYVSKSEVIANVDENANNLQ